MTSAATQGMSADATATAPCPDFSEIFRLEQTVPGVFRANSHYVAGHGRGIFGGSIVAQATLAAELSAEGRQPNSIHALFHRRGDDAAPVDYLVEATRDGATFSARRVRAMQADRLLFDGLVSLQLAEAGFEHQRDRRSGLTLPDDVPTLQEWSASCAESLDPAELASIALFGTGFETRVLNPEDLVMKRGAPRLAMWVRPHGSSAGLLPSKYVRAAFISDFVLPAAAHLPHMRSIFDPDFMMVSIDHAVWFHSPCPDDSWLFCESEGPWAGGGRGLNFSRIYAQDGRLVASSAQEQLVRPMNGRHA